ncbi:DUF5677 domain-containing protein [Agrococcus sp. DT81.2]|uniref:DUF5677 domain-containing protein n=1 Tax=Agrococcus sp. DT81.2 TaxID=3393414 RepID=UPI003CE5C35B
MNFPKPNQHSGPLAGHVRAGRVFKSPLAATGMLRVENWRKDDLPDLLWPVLVTAEQGDESMRRFVRWQAAVQEGLAHHDEPAFVAEALDGRLTSLASLARRFADAGDVILTAAAERGLLSPKVTTALASYPELPAPWLVGNVTVTQPDGTTLEFLHSAVAEIWVDEHRESLVKCLRTWSTVQAGTFRSSPETIELLKLFPTDPGTVDSAGAAVRAMWNAHKALLLSENGNRFADALAWARVFWGVNSMTTRCVRKRDTRAASEQDHPSGANPAPASGGATSPNPSEVPEGGAHLRRLAMDLISSFVEALETAPARLHDPERQEVVSGLVVRAGRDVVAVLGAPDLWCIEHGAHIGRMLVECKIYLHWMATQDPAIYRQFQEYGAGKAKLYARIADELPEDARTDGFRESVAELERLSHNDLPFDSRSVDTRDSFAEGKSIRAMAEEAGLLDFYRQAYSLASGVSHSEWWSLEAHSMEPCLNVLHGGHRVPNLSLSKGGNVELAGSWVDQLHSIMRAGLSILDTDTGCVSRAFAWLDYGDEHPASASDHPSDED